MSTTSKTLVAIGFSKPVSIAGLRSVAHLFASGEGRSGIYALVLSDDRVYIGKALDVVRRFAQHRAVHEAIEAIAFKAVKRDDIDLHERTLIAEAEAAGLHLTNIDHMTTLVGERDLDARVSREDQGRWLRDPRGVNREEAERAPLKMLPPGQAARFAARYVDLRARRNGFATVELLATYLGGSIPFPRTTEYSFWSVSCLPSTQAGDGPRLVVVNAGVMELFVLHGDPGPESKHIWGFVNVDLNSWVREFGRLRDFEQAFDDVKVVEASYRAAGSDVLQLHTFDAAMMRALLRDERVQRVAGDLALRLMRKRATIYKRYHCKPLADAALIVAAANEGLKTSVRDPGSVERLRALVPKKYWRVVVDAGGDSVARVHRTNPD